MTDDHPDVVMPWRVILGSAAWSAPALLVAALFSRPKAREDDRGPLPPPPAPSRRPWPWLGAAIALAGLLFLAGCEPWWPDYSHAGAGPPGWQDQPSRTASDWLERRDLAAVAHCPPPARGRGESDACQHLAWDFRR